MKSSFYLLIVMHPFSKRFSYRDISRYIYILLVSCTCARVHFFTCYCPTCEKLGSTINFLLVRFFVAEFVNWKNNGRILSAILLICILLKIKEWGIRSLVGHIIVVVTGYGEKRRWNEKKCVFETAEKEDVTVDVHIGYVGRSNNIVAVD